MPPVPLRQSEVDACPGALRLHAAADGPLARVRLPGGMLSGAQLAVLGDLAQTWGDGCLELTSRANIQLRALTAADPGQLAARLTAAGLLPSTTHEVVRNIAAPPLAGAEIRRLVRDLDRALCADPELAALPGRFLFGVGAVDLAADVAAVPTGTGRYALVLAGVDSGLRADATGVVAALLGAARAFLAERAARDPKPWRIIELPDGPATVARRLAAALPETLVSVDPSTVDVLLGELVGVVAQGEPPAVAVGALVPLGRLTRVHLGVLRRADRLAVTPARGIIVCDVAPEAAERWRQELAAVGLAVDAGSRWLGVTSCAGRPGCAKALADVRADAEATARSVAGLPVHWVGCARGCGSPAGAHVRVEATAAGSYRVSRLPGDPGRHAAGDAPAEAVPAGDAQVDPVLVCGGLVPAGDGLAETVAAARQGRDR